MGASLLRFDVGRACCRAGLGGVQRLGTAEQTFGRNGRACGNGAILCHPFADAAQSRGRSCARAARFGIARRCLEKGADGRRRRPRGRSAAASGCTTGPAIQTRATCTGQGSQGFTGFLRDCFGYAQTTFGRVGKRPENLGRTAAGFKRYEANPEIILPCRSSLAERRRGQDRPEECRALDQIAIR